MSEAQLFYNEDIVSAFTLNHVLDLVSFFYGQ